MGNGDALGQMDAVVVVIGIDQEGIKQVLLDPRDL